jgi:hypothetical protein
MAFINEKISEEDVKKYGIDALWDKYHIKREKPFGFYFSWTIDRDRDISLMRVHSGREELSNRITFVLIINGIVIEVELDKFGGDGSARLGDNKPMTTTWKMVSIHQPPNCLLTRDEIIQVLKESLTAYKVSGFSWPVEQHTALFRF